jgi:hypothetical protein
MGRGIKGMLKEGDFACCGWPDGSGICHSMSISKLMGLVHSEIAEISKL